MVEPRDLEWLLTMQAQVFLRRSMAPCFLLSAKFEQLDLASRVYHRRRDFPGTHQRDSAFRFCPIVDSLLCQRETGLRTPHCRSSLLGDKIVSSNFPPFEFCTYNLIISIALVN